MQYIVVAAIATAPSLILSLFLTGTPPATPADLFRMLPALVVSIVSYSLVSAVIVRMGSDVYLGTQPDVAATVRHVLKRVPALFGALLMTSFVAGISLVLFIFPVFYVVALLFATVPAIVIEQKGASAAMARSAKLSKGLKLHILGTLALVYGIYFVLSIGLSLGFAAIGNQMLQIVAMSIFGIVVSPIMNLALMVLYYDTRIRSEGFDVEHMAQSLGAPQSTPTAGGVLA
ncbi:MAG: hypothetical protein ABI852_04935 [Gemmatimonadaceae bacterium]